MSLDLFERPGHGERAVLVSVDFDGRNPGSVDEFRELAVSAGAIPVDTVTASRKAPDPRYFVGSGKARQILESVQTNGAEIVLFNHELSASQERNLEQLLSCRVLDRTGLILDIFAQRARSFEGQLQVELAQLKHLSTRLVRGWTHLERQRGGIGLRGPGETQLEMDRRLIGRRIIQLQKRLDKVDRQRQQNRRARSRAEVPIVSLVGYTNAGKSTLFNRITDAGVLAENRLFATLDSTVRRMPLPGMGDVVLADTVGFIQDLPHDLVAAFRSTLQETREADLLLHIIDIHDPDFPTRIKHVNEVLEQVGAEKVPQLIVYNKIDLTGRKPAITTDEQGMTVAVAVSAATGEGTGLLQQAIMQFLSKDMIHGWVHLPPGRGRDRALLFEHGCVLEERTDANGDFRLLIRIDRRQLARLGIPEPRTPDQPYSKVAGVV
jgi:GTP-binding protein HflX